MPKIFRGQSRAHNRIFLPGDTEDSRVESITVQHSLQYTPGWAALTLQSDQTIIDWKCWNGGAYSLDDFVRCGRGFPLIANPGANQQYTNYSRLALGRMLDRVTGMPYVQYVTSDLFTVASITGISMGQSRIANRPADEVRYYPFDWWAQPGAPEIGQRYDANGAWVATPAAVLRFFRAVGGDGPAGSILSAASTSLFTTNPPGISGQFLGPLGYPYATAGGTKFTGIGENTEGCMLYSYDRSGTSYVAALNSTCDATIDYGAWAILGDLDPIISRITNWPTTDLFATVP